MTDLKVDTETSSSVGPLDSYGESLFGG